MQRTFHPRGTTVRVRNFLKILPVRRQRALKNGSKQIADIKKLLYAYALSRLNIRFSFRVLKLKHGVDWVYSPSTPPSTNDAILKVVGAAVVANCTEISLSSSESAEDMHDLGSSMGPGQTSNKLYRGCIRLSAVLPKQDAGRLYQLSSFFHFILKKKREEKKEMNEKMLTGERFNQT